MTDTGSSSAESPSGAFEVCFLIGNDHTVLWADTDGEVSRLPDSRTRWEMIWALRADLVEIAHTHPNGPLAFSVEDLTTMAAIDAALGRSLAYGVVTASAYLRRDAEGSRTQVTDEPWWTTLLRAASAL